MQFSGVAQFFLGHFSNFNFATRYRGTLGTCGMRCFIALDGILIRNYSPSLSTYFEPFPVSDRKRVSSFLLIISQHANACYLFCLSGLNQKLQISDCCFRVICCKLDIQSSDCGMTSSFDSAD